MKKSDIQPIKIVVTAEDSSGANKMQHVIGESIIAAIDKNDETQVMLCGAFSGASMSNAIYHILHSLAEQHKMSVDAAIAAYQANNDPNTGEDFLAGLLNKLRPQDLNLN